MALVFALLVAGLVLSGCGDTAGGGDDAIDLGDTADGTDGTDTTDMTGDQSDADMVTGSSITFFLQNIGSETLYHQSGYNDSDWMQILDGAGGTYQLGTECGCTCESYPNCPVCDLAPPTANPIAPGDEVEYTWEGFIYESVEAPDGGSCLERRVLPDGEYEARFCWGNDSWGEDFSTAAVGFECDTLPFTLGTTTELRKGVAVDANLPGLEIIIENPGPTPVYIQSSGNNCEGQPTWFTITQGSETLTPYQLCGFCLCAQGPGCDVGCPDSCFGPSVTEIANGASESFVWDGLGSQHKNLDTDWSCDDWVGTANPEVSIEVCYGYSHTGGMDLFGNVENPVCTTMTATLGVDTEVRFSPPVPVP